MTDTRGCECSVSLVLQFVNSVLLLLVLVVQGSILDYYLILHNGGTSGWYFWFLADLLVLISFMAAVVMSYRYHKKKTRMREAGKTLDPNGKIQPKPKLGILPLSYFVWIFYSSLLIVKIILLFKMEIAQNLDEKTTFGPQLLKVVIGMSSVVFFLLVESHNDAEPLSPQLSFMHLLITSTAFEIFDSITFLGILLPNESKILLPYALEDAVLALACANFLLPSLALFKLSQSEFGSQPRSLGLSLVYKALHLLLINVPYLIIRIFLWTTYGRDISLFLMKNIMATVVLILTSIPDIRLWRRLVKAKREVKKVDLETKGLELKVIAGKEPETELGEKRKMIEEKFEEVNLSNNKNEQENSRL